MHAWEVRFSKYTFLKQSMKGMFDVQNRVQLANFWKIRSIR